MASPGNWVVPGADPANASGGVDSVGAGTPNVTITGTQNNPLINVSNLGGVTQVEGQIGNVNFNGVGITVAGGVPTAGDVTLTAAVQSIAGSGGGITVSQTTPGNYNLAVPSNNVNSLNQGAGINITQPTTGNFTIASVVQNVTGVLNATVTQPTAGTYQVSVPAPVYPVTSVTGTGIATASNVGSVYSIAVPAPVYPVTSVTGTGIASVSQPSTGVFQVQVPAPVYPVTSVTGTGDALVTQTSPGVFNVGVVIPPVSSAVNTLNTVSGIVNLTSTDASLTITPSGQNINLQANLLSVQALATLVTCNGQVNSGGTGQTLAPNTTAYFDVFPNNNILTLCGLRNRISAQINAPYTCSGAVANNTLSYGFVWGDPGTTPGNPANPTTNGVNNLNTSGIIGTAHFPSADIANPGTASQLYMVVINSSASLTYTITEIPNNLTFIFIQQ